MGAGVKKVKGGGMLITDGARVEIGLSPDGGRTCPFCGAPNRPEAKFCSHCGTKIVIERMRVSSLVVDGGELVIGGGGSLEIVGRRQREIHLAAAAGDLLRVKKCVLDGDDPDQEDGHGRRPLHYAAKAGKADVVRWLVSAGADPASEDDHGASPRAHAQRAGQHDVVRLLESIGG